MFEVVRVDSTHAEALEPLGTKPKFWYLDGERQMLFKAEERGTGEDWAEKLACELSDLLGLPHVHYELGFDEIANRPGVVCEKFTVPPFALAHGNQLLLALDPEYPVGRKYKVRSHTIDAVCNVVEAIEPPPVKWRAGTPATIESAKDFFCGYLMLDAWIANQDRHHQNWGAIWDGQQLHLAPTFDHGAAMARNLLDEERRERLTTKDRNRQIAFFARKARSAFYADSTEQQSLSTVRAWRAFADHAPIAAGVWLARLAEIEAATIERLIAQVPPDRMSAVCREFTLRLLEENRRRLLDQENE